MATAQSYRCQSCGLLENWTAISEHVQICTGRDSSTPAAIETASMDETIALLARQQEELVEEEGTIAVGNPDDVNQLHTNYAWSWSASAITVLLEAYKKHQDDFRSQNKKKFVIWREIARDMQKKGFDVDRNICDAKMRSLKKRYKAYKEKAAKTGHNHMRKWKFYHEMEELMADDPTVQPIALKSSLPLASTPSAAPLATAGAPLSIPGAPLATTGAPSVSGVQSSSLPTGVASSSLLPNILFCSPVLSVCKPPPSLEDTDSDSAIEQSPKKQRMENTTNIDHALLDSPEKVLGPKRQRMENTINMGHALLDSQEKVLDELINTSKKHNTTVKKFFETLQQENSALVNALEECQKEKEALQHKCEELYDYILKEKDDHWKKIKEMQQNHYREMKEILQKQKDEMNQLNHQHQEQLLKVILSRPSSRET